MTTLAFLVYDSRSGSTLLSALLNRFAVVTVSQESGFIPTILEFPGEIDRDKGLDRLLGKIAREIQFVELGLNMNALRARLMEYDGSLSKVVVIGAILEQYFTKRDPVASVWVIKSPRLFFHASCLNRLFPGVKFIHIVRDGRAVFNSKRTMKSVHGRLTQNNLIKAALDWKARLRMGRALGETLLEVRYEDLLASPDAALSRILDFLGVPRNGRAMTKSQEDYAGIIGKKQRHLHKNVGEAPKQELIGKWKRKLSGADILLYEWIAGDDLVRMGYSPMIRGKADLALCFRAFIRSAFYILHQAKSYVANLWWYLFVDRSIGDKLRAKLFEFRR